MDFKNFISSIGFEYVSSTEEAINLQEELEQFINSYEEYISYKERNKLISKTKTKGITLSQILEELQQEIDNIAENLEDEKRNFFHYFYSDVYKNFTGRSYSKSSKKIVIDFSPLESLHISKKKLRAALSEALQKDVKTYQIDKFNTIGKLKDFFNSQLSDSVNQQEKVEIRPEMSSSPKHDNNSINSTINKPIKKKKDRGNKVIKNPSKNLSEDDLQQLVEDLSWDTELFQKEEQKLNTKISNEQSELNTLKRQLSSLGSAPYVGPKPTSAIGSVFNYSFYPWIICLAILFAFHCVIWVIKLIFDISWDTWGWTKWWFWFGVIVVSGLCLVAAIIYGIRSYLREKRRKKRQIWDSEKSRLDKGIEDKNLKINTLKKEKEQIEENRKEVLLCAFRNKLALPIKSLNDWSYKKAKDAYFQILTLKNDTTKKHDLENSLKYFDRKYNIFYSYSIQSESSNPESLLIFRQNIPEKKGNMVFRGYTVPSELTSNGIRKLINNNDFYKEDALDTYIDDFNNTLNMDVSGIFTKYDSKSLEEQINLLEQVYNGTVSFVNSFNDVINRINITLGLSRLIAYRNIYLGAEFINIIRENGGGGKASTVYDSINQTSVGSFSNITITDFSINSSIGDMIVAGLDSMTNYIGVVLSDKQSVKFAKNNPKATALMAAGAAAYGIIEAGINAWKQRNAKIEGLLEKEELIIKGMESIVDSYLENKSIALRGIEIIEALNKVNSGFIKIYEPLYIKVFVNKDIQSVSMVELQQLALALNEFNKLSKTRL